MRAPTGVRWMPIMRTDAPVVVDVNNTDGLWPSVFILLSSFTVFFCCLLFGSCTYRISRPISITISVCYGLFSAIYFIYYYRLHCNNHADSTIKTFFFSHYRLAAATLWPTLRLFSSGMWMLKLHAWYSSANTFFAVPTIISPPSPDITRPSSSTCLKL